MTPPGLRERKKAKTRAMIREHALRLFDEQGYAATTVDQIAEAADVSPSTFFRYFPTKEDVVVADDFDPPMVAALRAQPAELHPIEAIRRSIRVVLEATTAEEWEQEQRRQRLLQSVPELRARTAHQYLDAIEMMAQVVAERAGLPADDFSARVLAGAVLGAAMAGGSPTLTYDRQDFGRFDQALALLQAGLPVGPQPADG